MIAVRGKRMLAMAITGALAVAGVVFGAATPALAVNDPLTPDITVHVVDELSTAVPGVTVDVIDPQTMLPVPGATGVTDALGDLVIADVVDPGYVYWVVARGTALVPVQYTDGTAEVEVTAGAWDAANPIIYSDHVTLSGTVRHANTALPYPNVWVTAEETGGDFYPSYLPTDSTGAWSILVPRGFSFTLFAETLNDEAYPQAWYHAPIDFLGIGGGCGCFSADEVDVTDPAPAGPTPAGPYDFDLWAVDTSFVVEVFAADALGGPFAGIPGLSIELFKRVGGGWTRVDLQATNTSGLADVFASSPGDYRLYYSFGGSYFSAEFSISFINGPLPMDPNGCYVELSTLTPHAGGAGDLVLVLFDPGTSHTCAAPTPPSSGGGTTIVTVHHTNKATPAFVVATPTPTPTPTPTSSPTPSSSPTHAPTASPSPTPDPEPAAADLWWLFWLLLVLLSLGIIITIIVIIRRR
ncbi:MAG TPA: hypothetical protein VGO65_10860 [Pseudolysinimonas sp.]|jgi:hypothetical protein|nr:hypothetical protein [Pseudolysinimonas sp.]